MVEIFIMGILMPAHQDTGGLAGGQTESREEGTCDNCLPINI
jgi:hypothetical protein